MLPVRLPSLDQYRSNVTLTPERVADIECVSSFVRLVNDYLGEPQPGFHWLPGSARALNGSEPLVHFTGQRDTLLSIVATGLRGRAAWYSSDTAHQHSSDGSFAFAYDLSLADLTTTQYGTWGILFTSTRAAKVYNTADEESQVILEAGSECPRLLMHYTGSQNHLGWLYDVYDLQLGLVARSVSINRVYQLFLAAPR